MLENDKVTAKELSEKFEISTRTIYRYLDVLACNGVPFQTIKGVNGGIVIDKNFCLCASLLNEDEKTYLFGMLNKNKDAISVKISNKLNLNADNHKFSEI